MAEYRFNDAAYLGKAQGQTTHESLAYLGSFYADVGVCVECVDEAYLGLAPGRTTFNRAAYIGLLDLPFVSGGAGGGDTNIHSGGYSAWDGDNLQRSGSRRTRDERKDDQDLIDSETEQEEIALVLWYLGLG